MGAIELFDEIDVDAAADEVWAVLVAYPRDPEWRTGVLEMTVSGDGPLEVGSTTRERIRVAGRTHTNVGLVTALEPGRRVGWRTIEGAQAHGARSVMPLDERRCRVRLELSVTPVGAQRLIAGIVRRALTRNLATDLTNLQRLVGTVPGRRDH